MAKWKCKICKQSWKENQDTCLNCEVSRRDLKNIWLCSDRNCKDINTTDKYRCETCGRRRKRKTVEKDIISRQEIIAKIKRIEYASHKAFFSMLYLTAARVSELLYNKEKNQGIRKKDIIADTIDGKEFLLIMNVPTLKRRKASLRSIPINVEREPGLVLNILDYLDTLKDEDVLFAFSRHNAKKYTYKYFGKEFYPHYFRHLRNTHFATEYGFDSIHLKQLNNWASVKSADFYIHLNPKDLAKRMI